MAVSPAAMILICLHVIHASPFVIHASLKSIGRSNLTEAALAACIAKVGRAPPTAPGGKWRRALPARAPKGSRPLETCTPVHSSRLAPLLRSAGGCESLRDSLGGALYRRAPPFPKRSTGSFCSIPPFGAPSYDRMFRALRSATRGSSPLDSRKLLKKFDQNF